MINRQVRIDSISVIYFDLFSLSLWFRLFYIWATILSSRTLDACQPGTSRSHQHWGGGGCRLTNISLDFDQVVQTFPENVVDGGDQKNFPN